MHLRAGDRSRTRTGRTLLAAGTVLLLGLTAACSETGGEPRTIGDVAGLPVTHFDSGLKAGAPAPDVEVRNVTNSTADRLAMTAVADVTDYWSAQLPKHFNQTFRPVEGYLSYDPTGEGIEVCGGSTSSAGMNAFYCPSEDIIAWDRAKLLPLLRRQFGPMAIPAVLAHEYGHAVQHRLGEKARISENTKTIVMEQQADCFAGSYFRWMAEGNSKYFKISTSNGLNQVLASLFFIRDAPGRSATAPGAHGTAFDRTYAFQLGFTKGADRCAEIRLSKVQDRITERPYDPGDQEQGYSRLDREMISYLQKSLNQAFQRVDAPTPRIVLRGGSCPNGGPSTPPASYCPDSNTVTIDLRALAKIGRPLDSRIPDSGLGDFAAFAEVASRYALGIQQGVGLPLDDKNAGLRTACLVGAWAGATNQDGNELRLSAGDLDEAIAELLQPNSLIAADVKGRQVPNGFARIEALRQGFLEGSAPCTKNYA